MTGHSFFFVANCSIKMVSLMRLAKNTQINNNKQHVGDFSNGCKKSIKNDRRKRYKIR
jgi:hypothetical protein